MKKYKTIGLKPGQYLTKQVNDGLGIEVYCIGYTDGKRDKSLDGWYYRIDLSEL